MKIRVKFSTFVELKSAIENYSKEQQQQFFIHSCCKLETRSKLSNSSNILSAPPELQYYFVKYMCVKSGNYKSSAKVRKTHTLRQGCEAGFRVKLSKCFKFLEVVAIKSMPQS